MSLLAGVSGCTKIAVGGSPNATVGTYSYITRELEVIYGAPLADVWPRALAAVDSLQLHIDWQRVDGLGGEIEARRLDNTMVRVYLKPIGEQGTSVSVRVGTWGDREMSERVQRAIRQQIAI
jgi:hypothetical protein